MLYLANKRTAVYRLFGEGDTLLYIGASHDVEQRYQGHASEKPWWPQVTRKTEEWFVDRATALAVERAAIESENPAYNKQFSPNHPSKQPIPEGCIAVADFRKDMNEHLAKIRYRGDIVYLVRHGKRVAALVPAADAEWIQAERERRRAAGES